AAAGEVLEHGEGGAVVLADVEDADDVGVGELRQGAHLTCEAAREARLVEDGGARHLDDDVALQDGVAGVVDVGRDDLAEPGEDVVAYVGDGQADPVGGVYGHPIWVVDCPCRVPGLSLANPQSKIETLPSTVGGRMRVVPVLDLKGGVVVRGVGGRRREYRPVVSRLVGSCAPADVAAAFAHHFGLRELYVADLDAIAGAPTSLAIYGELHALA